MEHDAPRTEPQDRGGVMPLERELAGLPELDRFASASDRAAALHAVHQRIEDPYAPSYWLWVAILVAAAIGAAQLMGWGVRRLGAPAPFPAALGIVAGLGTYFMLRRLVIRWAARPELERQLAASSQKKRS